MSTQDSRQNFTYFRSSRRRKIRIMGVNVEVPQPSEQSQRQLACQNVQGVTRNVSGSAVPPAPVHVEAHDDDVVILSPSEYVEARNRRVRGVDLVVDLSADLVSSSIASNRNLRRRVFLDRNLRRRVTPTESLARNRRYRGPNLVVDLSADLASSSSASNRNLRKRVTPTESPASCDCSVKRYVMRRRDPPAPSVTFAVCDCFLDRMAQPTVAQPPPPPPPPPAPPEPTFSCPVCMGSLVEEVTTKCGHIFCRGCIRQAILAQHKCPTCRKKVLMKDLTRIYLPSTLN